MEISLERAMDRINESFPATQVVEEVFSGNVEAERMLCALNELSTIGEIKAGGRRIRTLLGCEVTYDFSKNVRYDVTGLELNKQVRLGQLVNILCNFPEERMSNPDLDFFTTGIPLEKTIEVLQSQKFKTTLSKASGGVNIVEVQGSKGTATFIDSKDSWQTQPPWPLFGGIFAKYSTLPNPQFNVDFSHLRLYEFPLDFSGIETVSNKDPLDPQLFAAVGRILLWSVTVANPLGKRISIPTENTQNVIFKSVSQLSNLLKTIRQKPELKKIYSSGIRDMALALWVIDFADWDEIQATFSDYSVAEIDFMKKVSLSWWAGRLHPELAANDLKLYGM